MGLYIGPHPSHLIFRAKDHHSLYILAAIYTGNIKALLEARDNFFTTSWPVPYCSDRPGEIKMIPFSGNKIPILFLQDGYIALQLVEHGSQLVENASNSCYFTCNRS